MQLSLLYHLEAGAGLSRRRLGCPLFLTAPPSGELPSLILCPDSLRLFLIFMLFSVKIAADFWNCLVRKIIYLGSFAVNSIYFLLFSFPSARFSQFAVATTHVNLRIAMGEEVFRKKEIEKKCLIFLNTMFCPTCSPCYPFYCSVTDLNEPGGNTDFLWSLERKREGRRVRKLWKHKYLKLYISR